MSEPERPPPPADLPPRLEDESLPPELREALARLASPPPLAEDDPIFDAIAHYDRQIGRDPHEPENDTTEPPPPELEDASLPPELRQALARLASPPPLAEDDPIFDFIARKAEELEAARAEEARELEAEQAAASEGVAASSAASTTVSSEGAGVVPLEVAREKRRKKKTARRASDRPASGEGPKASEPPKVVSLGAWLRARPWVMPLTAAAALLVVYLVTRPDDGPNTAAGNDSYGCTELPPTYLDVLGRPELGSAEQVEGLRQSRELLQDRRPNEALDRIEKDQERFGGRALLTRIGQEREALAIRALRCSGKPFRPRAEAFLANSPLADLAASVKKDLAAGKAE